MRHTVGMAAVLLVLLTIVPPWLGLVLGASVRVFNAVAWGG